MPLEKTQDKKLEKASEKSQENVDRNPIGLIILINNMHD